MVSSFGSTYARTARSIGLRDGERGRGGAGVGGDEVLVAPGEDRADRDLVRLASICKHCGRLTHSLATSVSCVSSRSGRERLAAQTPAADRAAAEREIHARIVEGRQDRLLDLVEGHRLAGDPMRGALERAGNLPDAVRRVVVAALRDGVVVDDGPQDDRVVRVQPERHLLVARQRADGTAASEAT